MEGCNELEEVGILLPEVGCTGCKTAGILLRTGCCCTAGLELLRTAAAEGTLVLVLLLPAELRKGCRVLALLPDPAGPAEGSKAAAAVRILVPEEGGWGSELRFVAAAVELEERILQSWG